MTVGRQSQRPPRSLVKLRCNQWHKERIGPHWTDREILTLTKFAQHWLCFQRLGSIGALGLCCLRQQMATILDSGNMRHFHQKALWDSTALDTNSVQFSSAAEYCLTRCDPMNRSTSGLPVHHQLPEFTQTHVHWVGDAIQPSHPLSSPSPPAPDPSQHQSFPMSQLFAWDTN